MSVGEKESAIGVQAKEVDKRANMGEDAFLFLFLSFSLNYSTLL